MWVRWGTKEAARAPSGPCVFRSPSPISISHIIVGQLGAGHVNCLVQGLTSSKHTGELAPRGSGNQTLRATQRSKNMWKSDHALGVRSQEHRFPTGTRNRWHPANTSQVTTGAALLLGQVTTRWSSSARLHSALGPPGMSPVALALLLTICSPSSPQVVHLPPPTHDSPHDDPSMSCHIQLEMQGASSSQRQPRED